MKFVIIIPARYQSTRFPGKPLAVLGGKPVIQRVYEQAKSVLPDVWVATDDDRIFLAVEGFGGKAVMTRADHKSGTDRIQEAAEKIGGDFDVIINIQGDEPFIDPEQINLMVDLISRDDTQLASLAKHIRLEDELYSPNTVKVVMDVEGKALYFSRHPIPFMRNEEMTDWLAKGLFFKHIGIYAYKAETLRVIAKMPMSALEKSESLEQLRWLENGFDIRMGITDTENVSIDTPSDLQKAESFLTSRPLSGAEAPHNQ